MKKVSIVICWQAGTEPMIRTCIASIERHTDSDLINELILVSAESNVPNNPIDWDCKLNIVNMNLDNIAGQSSKRHGAMLDVVIPDKLSKSSDYVISMDSDCFPIADGWLNELKEMIDGGNSCVGILHPWAPPPLDLKQNTIEYRVRNQHNWEATHVACQMMPIELVVALKAEGAKYNGGDDTGLLFPKMIKAKGLKIDGFKPTRCPIVKNSDLDPEFNRYSCIVYGDKVYHHGGFSRNTLDGNKMVFGNSVGWVQDIILENKGAEFLLEYKNSYKFKLDREEEVAKEKMQRLFGLKAQNMKG